MVCGKEQDINEHLSALVYEQTISNTLSKSKGTFPYVNMIRIFDVFWILRNRQHTHLTSVKTQRNSLRQRRLIQKEKICESLIKILTFLTYFLVLSSTLFHSFSLSFFFLCHTLCLSLSLVCIFLNIRTFWDCQLNLSLSVQTGHQRNWKIYTQTYTNKFLKIPISNSVYNFRSHI